jgi:hypothetical protein
MTSPVDFRRKSWRSSMYASPRSRAARASAALAAPSLARSYARSPSTTLIVVPNDPTVAPRSTSQFQPPSSSCSPSRRSTSGVMSTPKYEPVATTLPLMHGSTSPSKKPASAHGGSHHAPSPQVTRSRTRPIASCASGLAGSRPRRRRSSITWNVSVRSCENALPAQRPSSVWRASSCAPQPSVPTRARSAATTLAGSCVRSRITCQRIAASASSSQSTIATDIAVSEWRATCGRPAGAPRAGAAPGS